MPPKRTAKNLKISFLQKEFTLSSFGTVGDVHATKQSRQHACKLLTQQPCQIAKAGTTEVLFLLGLVKSV
jgi:hypothetical protein